MLSASEFTVGAFKDALPGSLILPRSEREETVLIGRVANAPAAVFLSERSRYEYFLTADSDNWYGLIIPNVRIEVDEKSVFDPSYGNHLGAIQRVGTTISIRAKADRSLSANYIVLEDGLDSVGEFKAAFTRWQVIMGEGFSKRILWQAPASKV
ncbi:hypothetical protein G9X64_29690 [Rhizobium sophorae]|uniref:Uncharacterized protein n=1 Tax=Rhizobium sophorae TaxID=1535242 RepID=A0A7Y3SBE6_9HYPH|nr:hypothetical protein [Rhizobium sophorae]NNU40583.1 hypothetical protein [Rhizobium sophorae]